MTSKTYLLLVLVCTALYSCGPQIYKSNEFADITSKHKIVAILPTVVTTQLRPNEMKKITKEQLEESEQKTGYDVQEKMYNWFLRRSDKFNYSVTFQDVSKTVALLEKAGVTYTNIKKYTKEELCKMLDVDAVISSSAEMKKPMSDGAAIAVGLLVGVWGSTNNVNTTINIHDGKTGTLVWNYDWTASGSVGSTTEALVNGLMRNVSRRFPYNIPKK